MEWSCGGGVVSAIILVHAGIMYLWLFWLIASKKRVQRKLAHLQQQSQIPTGHETQLQPRTERSLSRQQ